MTCASSALASVGPRRDSGSLGYFTGRSLENIRARSVSYAYPKMMDSDQEPIVAVATAPGRAGIGVVRVSGVQIDDLLAGVLGPARASHLRPRRATHAQFLDARGRAIDDGIA